MENNETKKNYFQELHDIDVSKYVKVKDKLTYLSWSYAWAEAKKRYPYMYDTIYERVIDSYGNTVNYFTDGKTCWVKVGVTIDNFEHVVELPVMDYRNKAIPLEQVTSCDVNKAIQRCMTKAIAKHGIGLYIYNGEDLPEAVIEANKAEEEELKKRIKDVVKLGTQLIKIGVTKDQMVSIIASLNDGNGNPSSIKSLGVCDNVINELSKLNKTTSTTKQGDKK